VRNARTEMSLRERFALLIHAPFCAFSGTTL